jgi:hypothetical protein
VEDGGGHGISMSDLKNFPAKFALHYVWNKVRSRIVIFFPSCASAVWNICG